MNISKSIVSFLILLFGITNVFSQIRNLPNFETQSGVNKTVMNPNLFPLLLKVKISGGETNARFYKEFVGNLTSFETYASDNNAIGEVLLNKVNQYVSTNSFVTVEENLFERLAPKQREFILVKNETGTPPKAYAFTTKLSFTDVQQLKLLLNQYF